MVATRVHAVWLCGPYDSTEHFVLSETPTGWSMRGVVSISIDDEPAEIRYEVATDREWSTRSAQIELDQRTIDVSVTEEGWIVDGVLVPDLTGCVDIDLGWTPSTNTLPMRRLDIGVGETAETRAAWLSFPELVFSPASQTYTRLASNRWRYRSGGADYEIETSPDGVVCRYGDMWWGSVGRAPSP